MWPYDDFVEYWAAARLNLAGANPYDTAAMLEVQRAAGYEGDAPIMMYNPPWALLLAYPFALFDWPVARLLGAVVQTCVLLFCAERIGRISGSGRARDGERGILSALTFAPVWIALRMGQFSIFQLGGVTALLGLSATSGMLRGAALALLLLKPPLAAVPGFLILLWWARAHAHRAILGLVAAVLVASATVSITNPPVFAQYLDAMVHQPPAHFVSPTVGSLLRAWLAPSNIWFQFLPTIAGLAWAGWYWHGRRHRWSWREHLPLPLFVACLTTGYGGWPLDLVVLLPALILVALRIKARLSDRRLLIVLAFYGMVQASLFVLHRPVTPQWTFVWLTPALLCLYLIARRVQEKAGAVRPGFSVSDASG